MHRSISLTLVADGSSDEALLPLVRLLLDEHCPLPYRTAFSLRRPDGHSLPAKLQAALSDHPCDILLVHRDAEGRPALERTEEIDRAVAAAEVAVKHIPIVPVRMTEAWLLTDEHAIRAAVGNPNGRTPLDLPSLERLESVDAKDVLLRALETAKELGPRRLRSFSPEAYRLRVAELTQSVARLRRLQSFWEFENQLVPALTAFA